MSVREQDGRGAVIDQIADQQRLVDEDEALLADHSEVGDAETDAERHERDPATATGGSQAGLPPLCG